MREARSSDLHRAAAAHRRPAVDPAPAVADPSVTLRLGRPVDAPALLRLAELDSAPPLTEPVLIGEASGRLVAAISLADARAIANPYEHSVAVAELLRARARQLSGAGPRTRFLRATFAARAAPRRRRLSRLT
jgi:hypothetical protein